MARSKSSHRWLAEHFDDPYVKRAHAEGWRSRAVFKLDEIQQRDRLIRPHQTIVDLGAAPGGWAQMARKLMGRSGRVIALDILPIEPLEGVERIHGDFREQAALSELQALLGGAPADLVLSDMAPNMSGTDAVDLARATVLAELAMDFADQHLKPGGDFVVKLFQGEGFDDYVRALRGRFERLMIRKPKASRPRSREVYAVAKGHRAPASA